MRSCTIKLGLLALSASFCLLSCKKEPKTPIKPPEVVFKKEGELKIYKAKSDSLITALDIEIAKTDYEIQTGLMYRNSMKANEGMLFIFPNMQERSFYMKNTRIALDIIYIDDEFKVVSFQENAQPFNEASLRSNVPAKYVLEVNAGKVKTWGLKVGDSLIYKEL